MMFSLFSTHSYVIQTNDPFEITPRSSAKKITKHFNNIYDAKTPEEKAIIIRDLIPILFSRLDQKIKNNSWEFGRQ